MDCEKGLTFVEFILRIIHFWVNVKLVGPTKTSDFQKSNPFSMGLNAPTILKETITTTLTYPRLMRSKYHLTGIHQPEKKS